MRATSLAESDTVEGQTPHSLTRSRIVSTGSALPRTAISNQELSNYLDTNDDWIKDRVGIRTRYLCDEDETCVSLACDAVSLALKRAALQPDDIDLVIFATITPDQHLPSAAALLCEQLGIHNSLAFDISAACSGFLFALTTADSLLPTINGKNAVIVGAETLSRIVDWEDRNTAVLFGDGAGACILQSQNVPSSQSCILSSHLKTQAEGARFIQRKGGAFPPVCKPASNVKRSNEPTSPYMKMAGREVFKAGVTYMTQSIEHALESAQIRVDDISLFIPHQSNMRMISAVCKNVGLPKSKLGANIDRVGNTSAASIPIVLDEYAASGRINSGDLVLLTAVGSGMTYGSLILKW